MNTIGSNLKVPLNVVLTAFKALANKIIDVWNFVKKQINKLSFDIPDWVPGIGGKEFGFNFEMSDHIELPKLAKGGLILRHTFAEIDELNKSEVILPLTNTKTMGMIADSILENASYSSGEYAGGYNRENTEGLLYETRVQNQLLEEQNILLEAIFKKPNLGKDNIGKVSLGYIQGEERRLQKSLVGLYD